MTNGSRVWVEWIPNISAGRDPEVIESIVAAFEGIPNLYLLHTDRSAEVNRTVLTVVGTLPSLRKATLLLFEILQDKIHMSRHQGTHPRIGALDVSPFVSLNPRDKSLIIPWINDLAGEISEKFHFPVYLYEDSASSIYRKNLADIRSGEYEELELKIKDPRWHPDFGTVFHPGLGATVMGVRDFLIAYNINLSTDQVSIARMMATQLREKGLADRPFALPGVKAIGWYLNNENICQISTNITQTDRADPLMVFEQCKMIAGKYDTLVTDSELIGLLPYYVVERMLKAGFEDTIALSQYLGLGYAGIHDLRDRIIEYKLYIASGKELFREMFEKS